MNYAKLSPDELRHKIREMQMEGIDAVYLDEVEWRELQVKLIKSMEEHVMAYKDPQPEGQKYFEYSGMKFCIVENGGFEEGDTILSKAFYRAFQNVYEVNK